MRADGMDAVALSENMDEPVFSIEPSAKRASKLGHCRKVVDAVSEGKRVKRGCNLMVADLRWKFRSQELEVRKE